MALFKKGGRPLTMGQAPRFPRIKVDDMILYVYVKNTEDLSSFEQVIDSVRKDAIDIRIITESRRSFRELGKIQGILCTEDIVVVYDLSSLGLNEADIANQLEWFMAKSVCLVICTAESTYRFGVYQPMNKAILMTLIQSILSHNKNVVRLPENRRKNSGRNRISYPDGWEDLYNLWTNKDISSKEFLERTGLKKATFYNLLTEYKAMQKELDAFQRQYKLL